MEFGLEFGLYFGLYFGLNVFCKNIFASLPNTGILVIGVMLYVPTHTWT